jgi:hypothetical protein
LPELGLELIETSPGTSGDISNGLVTFRVAAWDPAVGEVDGDGSFALMRVPAPKGETPELAIQRLFVQFKEKTELSRRGATLRSGQRAIVAVYDVVVDGKTRNVRAVAAGSGESIWYIGAWDMTAERFDALASGLQLPAAGGAARGGTGRARAAGGLRAGAGGPLSHAAELKVAAAVGAQETPKPVPAPWYAAPHRWPWFIWMPVGAGSLFAAYISVRWVVRKCMESINDAGDREQSGEEK